MLPHVIRIRSKGRDYYYFRHGEEDRASDDRKRIRLPGAPGSREFLRAYEALVAEHIPAPAPKAGAGFPVGSLGWAIEQYKLKSPEWRDNTASTREVYDRHFAWLTDKLGPIPLASFSHDPDLVLDIRDHADFADRHSVADMTVERFAQVWDWARNFLRADVKLSGVNPGRGIKKAHRGEGESAPLWPLALCRKFEQLDDRDLVTFYYLARYTGQRRSDLANMKWEHIDRDEMFVAQVKTKTRIWVPMPKPLRDYLDALPRTGPYIVMSPKHGYGRGGAKNGPGRPWRATSITNEFIKATKALGFETTDSKGEPRFYSPHGLRHLCGVELNHAGATDRQIAAVLGHATLRMVQVYARQSNQRLLAREAQKKRDEMYAREAAVDAADNVARLQARGRLANEK
jgi:integrase